MSTSNEQFIQKEEKEKNASEWTENFNIYMAELWLSFYIETSYKCTLIIIELLDIKRLTPSVRGCIPKGRMRCSVVKYATMAAKMTKSTKISHKMH